MSKPPDKIIKLSDTLTLCEYTSPRNGSFGFWLYDEMRGMNLSMRAKTATDAFVEALAYYQERLKTVEQDNTKMRSAIETFIAQFSTEED